MKARTRPDILREVLGPYEKYSPCEASEQKPISGLKDIKLSYCRHSICLQITSIQKKPGFFVGLNQKSAMISMCKIHNYIDSECFRKIH